MSTRISQLIRDEEKESISKIIITASGGAFETSKSQLVNVTPDQASTHLIGIWVRE